MDDWLVRQVIVLGLPFQKWMIVLFVVMLIATLIKIAEKN
jgi:hypothetical protein